MKETDDVENKVKNFIDENKLIYPGDNIVLGVSGGSDSLCMLMIINKLYGDSVNLCVAHINHKLREEADEESKYVADLCKKHCIPFRLCIKDVSEYSKKNGMGTEEAGRKIRYDFFEECGKKEWNCTDYKIAVAHNRGDNAETVLLNMLRGSDLKGIIGIEPRRDRVIRPILCLTKEETIKYLRGNGIEYCKDASNDSDDYARNRVRHNILQYASENINSGAINNICNLSESLALLNDYLESQTEELFLKYTYERESGKRLFIKSDILHECHPYMVRTVLYKAFGFVSTRLKDVEKKHILLIGSLFEMDNGKSFNLPYKITALKVPGAVLISSQDAEDNTDSKKITVENSPVELIPGEVLQVMGKTIETELYSVSGEEARELIKGISEEQYTKLFDYDKISHTVFFRTRKEHDEIVVNDAGGRQTLKKYFINSKVPSDKRDEILLMCDGKEVIWVISGRIGANYKLSEETRNILKVTVKEP